MIIGFEDQKVVAQEQKPLSEEDIKKYRNTIEEARKKLYIPEHRMNQMLQAYDRIIVHDFNDSYHMSDEEREEQNKFYRMFGKLNRCKRRYRRINEFIDCARQSLECLDVVAHNNNTVYDPEKFKSMVLRGKINLFGWFFPVYRGRDRKQLDGTYLAEFILSDASPSEFLKNSDDAKTNYMTPDQIREAGALLFDPGELEAFISSDERLMDETMKPVDLDDDSIDVGSTVVEIADKSHVKSLIKLSPGFACRLKEIQREERSKELVSSYVSDIHVSDLEFLERFDSKHGIKSESDIPEFEGDITNEDDYNRYLYNLQVWEDTQVKVNYAGKMRSNEEIREIELREALDDAGWNIRKLYGNDKVAKKIKEAQKADKKREKKLHKQLLQVQKRSKRRMDKYGLSDNSDSKSKKGKRKSKKKKKESD